MPRAKGNPNLFILTGGPGAGKTSVVEALAARGMRTTREAGRAVIAAHAATGSPRPWNDPLRFADLMLGHDIAEYERLAIGGTTAFFDRGVPDLIGYLNLMGYPVTDRIRAAARHHPYNQKVFLFPAWQEIYVQDTERHQDFAEAARTCSIMESVYRTLGYTLIEVPRTTVAKRVDFILSATID